MSEDHADIPAMLKAHEAKSQWRYEELMKLVTAQKGDKDMGMTDIMDKVNINVGGDGSGGLGGMAGLLGLLSNRNSDPNNLATLMAAGGGGGFGGGNNIWPILLLALLGRDRGGLFGGGGNDCGVPVDRISPAEAAILQNISQGVNGLTAAVPNSALETQNALLEQTNQFTSLLNASTLFNSQNFASVKDSVQNTSAALLANANSNTNSILAAVQGVKDQASGYRISDLERQLTVAQLDERDARLARRFDGVEVNVAQTSTQIQAQGQAQQQAQVQGIVAGINHIIRELGENTQLSRATAANTNFIVGNAGAATTGAQTATPTSTNVSA